MSSLVIPTLSSSLAIKFQRDLNRTNDSERNTRKKGLQKLLEELPWTKKSQREELKDFVYNHMLSIIIPRISDSIEKCREYTIEIIKKCLEKCNDISYQYLYQLTVDLCNRINETPFPEIAEEIRLLVIEALVMIYNHPTLTSLIKEKDILADIISQALCKALSDGFPSVKRISSELICLISISSPTCIRTYYKSLLKNLQLNSSHQHSKTRSITLQAIGNGLICMLATEDYIQLLKEPILSIFLRTVSDRTPIVRADLAVVIANILSYRMKYCFHHLQQPLDQIDYELVTILFLLHGDEIDEVAISSKQQLKQCIQYWDKNIHHNEIHISINNNVTPMIEDGELEMQSMNAISTNNSDPLHPMMIRNIGTTIVKTDNELENILNDFISTNLNSILPILQVGVESWTTDSRKRYLKALDCFLIYASDISLNSYISKLLSIVALHIRDEEMEVRSAAQQCCKRIGSKCSMIKLLDILLPLVSSGSSATTIGSSSSIQSDSISKRANLIAVFTYVIEGCSTNHSILNLQSFETTKDTNIHLMNIDTIATSGSVEIDDTVSALYVCTMITACFSEAVLYIHREAAFREAILLFIRKLIHVFKIQIQSSHNIQEQLIYGLLFLTAKCPGEEDVIPEVARKELQHLAILCDSNSNTNDISIDNNNNSSNSSSISLAIGKHYLYVLKRIIYFDEEITNGSSSIESCKGFNVNVQWEPSSPALGAFTILIRECPDVSWQYQHLLMPIFISMVQPKAPPTPGSAEANALSYAAQRGEEVINTNIGMVDVRLNLIALLEGLIRAGTSNWECSRYIASACDVVIKQVLLPNLIWRVGRVESTVRKVALATCYALLKAGSIEPETLFKNASELVPLMVSHLDDFDVTPRQMACLCVTILFERLRGVFSEQSVREIYPKLLTRLDDSNDYIRISICDAIIMFFQCAVNKHCYSGTTLDYMLDQLYIHLDDSNPDMQQAVLKAIIQASKLDKELVIKKAENNRCNHRTPLMCDKVIIEVTGIEILED